MIQNTAGPFDMERPAISDTCHYITDLMLNVPLQVLLIFIKISFILTWELWIIFLTPTYVDESSTLETWELLSLRYLFKEL